MSKPQVTHSHDSPPPDQPAGGPGAPAPAGTRAVGSGTESRPGRRPRIVLLGTLDTKGPEFFYVRDRLTAAGCEVTVVDAGVRSETPSGDVSADEVAAAAGADRRTLAQSPDRGAAVVTMARGAARIAQQLHADGRLDGIMGLGGSGGSSIVAAAMQSLPFGVPKLLVSTMASGDTRAYVGSSDITMMFPVVDIAGINSVSERVLTNAAAAMAGMATAARDFTPSRAARPVVAATMYGTTTPCVSTAREYLESLGYEVLVFHANGAGGRIMESLVRSGVVSAVLDVTTAELADEVVGGTMTAGPDRLDAAGSIGIPQVVSLGGLEQVCFGPLETLPDRFRDRPHYVHNASVTLVRPTAEEGAALARLMASKLNAARGPVSVFIPLRGFTAYSAPGGPMYEPDLDAAFVRELKAALRRDMDVVEMDTDINDPAFARAMAERLDEFCRAGDSAPTPLQAGAARPTRPELPR